jgi:hypothetical protein
MRKKVFKFLYWCFVIAVGITSVGCSSMDKDSKETAASNEFITGFENEKIDTAGVSIFKPAGWKRIDMGYQIAYIPPEMENKEDRLMLLVTNFELYKESDSMLQLKLFEKGLSTKEWVERIKVTMDKVEGMPKYEIVKRKDLGAKAVLIKVTEPDSKVRQYCIFKVVNDKPISVAIEVYGKYSEGDYIEKSGILNDLIHVAGSIKMIK